MQTLLYFILFYFFCNWRSCDHNGDQGCNGGLMDNAFGWIKENGICAEADYPYEGVTGQCKSPKCTPVATMTGHEDVPE